MIFQTTLEQFHGPLDLLLQLIEKEDLDIAKVTLARVTEEYLAYVEKLPESRTAEIADFLVVAARLVYLKSKLLAPDDESEDDGAIALEDQLRLYKRFVDAARALEEKYASGMTAHFRECGPLIGEFIEPKNVTASLLERVMRQIVEIHAKRRQIIQRIQIDNVISIEESIARIRAFLGSGRQCVFNNVIRRNAPRAEQVVHFLALLELVKQRQVRVMQRALFGEIHVSAV